MKNSNLKYFIWSGIFAFATLLGFIGQATTEGRFGEQAAASVLPRKARNNYATRSNYVSPTGHAIERKKYETGMTISGVVWKIGLIGFFLTVFLYWRNVDKIHVDPEVIKCYRPNCDRIFCRIMAVENSGV